MDGSVVQARMLPQLSGRSDGVEIDRFPPLRFVAPVMKGTMMMGAAEGTHELVADPAAERPRLRAPQVTGVRRPASAQKAGLRGGFGSLGLRANCGNREYLRLLRGEY